MTDPTWLFTGTPATPGQTGVLMRARQSAPPEAIPIRRELVIGREDTCDVVLANPLVSRQHARVWPFDGRFAVEDLGSSNGTYVNGQRITSARELKRGDWLRVGDAELQFRLVSAAAVPSLPLEPVGPALPAYQGPTQPTPASEEPTTTSSAPEPSVGAKSLSLAVLGSLVGAGFSQALGTGRLGAFALAAIIPLLTTTFTLRKDGKVRMAPVVLVTAFAVAVTVVVVTAADFTLGRSVFPWSSAVSTFVPVPDQGTPTAPKVTVPKLVGLDNASCEQMLSRAGFNLENVLMLSAAAPPASIGKVVRTDPPAGALVPNNAVVRVYFGAGG